VDALARALGATPRNVAAGLTAAQLLPAVPGTLFGIPRASGCSRPRITAG
jgi:putative ABC transport system permease protein